MAYITTADLIELGYKWDVAVTPQLDQLCITAASMVDAYIQRVLPGKYSLELNDIEETVNARVRMGVVKIFPKYYNINNIVSIVISSGMLSDLDIVADNIKILPKDQFILARVLVHDGEYYATVKYSAGFGVDAEDISLLPVEIKKATILITQNLLSEFFMVKNFNISMLTMFKQGDLQFQRSSKLLGEAIPNSAQLLLTEYRRIR